MASNLASSSSSSTIGEASRSSTTGQIVRLSSADASQHAEALRELATACYPGAVPADGDVLSICGRCFRFDYAAADDNAPTVALPAAKPRKAAATPKKSPRAPPSDRKKENADNTGNAPTAFNPLAAVAAAAVGDVRRLTSGEDYAGALCGVGALEDRPYIVYPNLADDLKRYQGMLSTAPWAVPLGQNAACVMRSVSHVHRFPVLALPNTSSGSYGWNRMWSLTCGCGPQRRRGAQRTAGAGATSLTG